VLVSASPDPAKRGAEHETLVSDSDDSGQGEALLAVLDVVARHQSSTSETAAALRASLAASRAAALDDLLCYIELLGTGVVPLVKSRGHSTDPTAHSIRDWAGVTREQDAVVADQLRAGRR
jgi:hypothetical protein